MGKIFIVDAFLSSLEDDSDFLLCLPGGCDPPDGLFISSKIGYLRGYATCSTVVAPLILM